MGLAAAQECANAIEIAYDQGSGGEFAPGSGNYDSCREYLRDLCLVTGMNYLYLCRYDIENDTITYIMAVGMSDAKNDVISRDRPYGTVVTSGIDDVEKRALAGEEVKEALETDNQFGEMLDWVSPVREMGNDVLAGASYSVTEQRQREMANVWSSFVPERTETAGAGFSACGFSRPARSVGGDFYDVLKLENGRLARARRG